MSDDVVIKADGLWKRYGLPLGPAVRRFSRRVRGESTDNPDADGPWALRDVNFEVKRGETLGIVGRNGAGKSTLLKVLAGVTPPTHGSVSVVGTVFPMIELNAGLHFELTGRENARLLGAIMGFARHQIETIMPQIEEFCELGEWFDRPVRKYSSGMLVRLGFSVGVNVPADMLLVDEVLAVGDLAFQRKCFSEIERLRGDEGTTILFVSHSIRQVERLCDRAIMLETGQLVGAGEPTKVINQYTENNIQREQEAVTRRFANLHQPRQGTGEMEIASIELHKKGQRVYEVEVGDRVTLRLNYLAHEYVSQPIVAVSIWSADMVPVTSFTNEHQVDRPSYQGEGFIDCAILNLPILPGIYSMVIKLIGADSHTIFLSDYQLGTIRMVIPHDKSDERWTGYQGFVYVDVDWEYNTPA